MAILNDSDSLVIYDDLGTNSNPQQRFVDWKKSIVAWSVSNPLNEQFLIPPNSSAFVFGGARTTNIASDTVFSIALNPVNSSIYRIFKTARYHS